MPLVVGTTVETAGAANGTITGLVFRDYNYNGVRDNRMTADHSSDPDYPNGFEPGEAGITVTAYDNSATPQSWTTTTGANGAYSLPITGAATAAIRVEMSIPVAKSYLKPGVPLTGRTDGDVRFQASATAVSTLPSRTHLNTAGTPAH